MKNIMSSRCLFGIIAALSLTLAACGMEDGGDDWVEGDEILVPTDGSAPVNEAGVTTSTVVANGFGNCVPAGIHIGKTCRLANSEYSGFDNTRHCQEPAPGKTNNACN